MVSMFRDRADAGRVLAARLARFDDDTVTVLAMPRGGVPVAAEVARSLDAPMDVIGVRKLGAPMQPELAVGAIAEGGVRILDGRAIRMLGIDDATIEAIEARERVELQRQVRAYRGDRDMPTLSGRTVIVVDDGLATGSSARVACRAVRQHRPRWLVLAVPVASGAAVESLRSEADDVVSAEIPPNFTAVGLWYRDFAQVTDEDVMALLEETSARQRGS